MMTTQQALAKLQTRNILGGLAIHKGEDVLLITADELDQLAAAIDAARARRYRPRIAVHKAKKRWPNPVSTHTPANRS